MLIKHWFHNPLLTLGFLKQMSDYVTQQNMRAYLFLCVLTVRQIPTDVTILKPLWSPPSFVAIILDQT